MKKLNSSFVLPEYGGDCFSNIPAMVLDLFGVKSKKPTVSKKHYGKYLNGQYDNVVLFLIDVLGFYQWKKYANQFPLFKMLDSDGHLFPATSIFPSTTSAAINTISSGLTPAEHGLFEWTLYMPEIDMTIETLIFSEIGEKRDSLLDKGVASKILFDFSTIYQRLQKHGVNSFSFTDRGYANSAYSAVSRKGSTSIPFVNFSDLTVKLRNQLVKNKGKNYYFVYWDKLDGLGHKYGPDDDACKIELSKISHLLLTEFINKLDEKIRKRTLLIVTADHGQIAVDPKKTIYLGKDKRLMGSLCRDKKGEIILPTGSGRGVYLHVKEEEVEEIYKYLKNRFKNKADVVYTDELIASGLFGQNKIKAKFRDRLGNLTLLPHKNYVIWRRYKGKISEHLGRHGGLSKKEMMIPISICSAEEIYRG